MEPSDLRRKDTTRGRPLRILSLDGGGVRGYSMLILLREFMHKTYEEIYSESSRDPDAEEPDQNRDVEPKPCDYFDLIAGTGTGGLIAIMLGRLRMDLVKCMEVYVKMTQKVFETDKTIAGIPYRSTLFKASKLEDAIRECVYDNEDEKNHHSAISGRKTPMSPGRSGSMYSAINGAPRRSMSFASSRTGRTSNLDSSKYQRHPGDPNADLYDSRANRTKTAVTAVYKGASKGDAPALLRSYRSRKKPPPEFKCKIWQAGRATCATKLAFKPIQLGQSVFLDEGDGMINLDRSPTYNPAPQILDEAVLDEWPGREVGVFLSIGTGKRPGGTSNMQSEWWEGFVGGIGDFAEAKRKLMLKIEGCEKTHQDMLSTHLRKRGVSEERYFRLNVEVGVGEFGMNEWNRLTDIRNNTELYLNKPEVKGNIEKAAIKMAKIEEERHSHVPPTPSSSNYYENFDSAYVPPPSDPNAIELPGEGIPPLPSLYPRPLSTPGPQYPASPQYSYQQASSPQDKFALLSADEVPQYTEQAPIRDSQYLSGARSLDSRRNPFPHSPNSSGGPSPRRSHDAQAPPLPPKTPIPFPEKEDTRRHTVPHRTNGQVVLPYPDDDGPPPPVNMARKPEYIRR